MWKAARSLALSALPPLGNAALRVAAPAAVERLTSPKNRTLMLAGAALAVTALVASRRAAKRNRATWAP